MPDASRIRLFALESPIALLACLVAATVLNTVSVDLVLKGWLHDAAIATAVPDRFPPTDAETSPAGRLAALLRKWASPAGGEAAGGQPAVSPFPELQGYGKAIAAKLALGSTTELKTSERAALRDWLDGELAVLGPAGINRVWELRSAVDFVGDHRPAAPGGPGAGATIADALEPELTRFHDAFRGQRAAVSLRMLNGFITWLICLAFWIGVLQLVIRAVIGVSERLALGRELIPALERLAFLREGPRGLGFRLIPALPEVGRLLDVTPQQIGNEIVTGEWRGRDDSEGRVVELVRSSLQVLSEGARYGDAKASIQEDVGRLEAELDAQYVALSYILWVIPCLGFIGTVYGISDAMMNSHQLLDPDGDKQTATQDMTTRLSYAFDTTFVALLLGIVLMLLLQISRRYEEGVLHRAAGYLRALASASAVVTTIRSRDDG